MRSLSQNTVSSYSLEYESTSDSTKQEFKSTNAFSTLLEFSELISAVAIESTIKVAKKSKEEERTALQQAQRIQSSFVAEQEWEGFVTDFDEKNFYARLIDLTNKGIEENAQFEAEDISPADRELLKEGAIFRWSIGYERLTGGTKRRISSIVFRRLPAWSRRDIEASKQEAESLISGIQWI